MESNYIRHMSRESKLISYKALQNHLLTSFLGSRKRQHSNSGSNSSDYENMQRSQSTQRRSISVSQRIQRQSPSQSSDTK